MLCAPCCARCAAPRCAAQYEVDTDSIGNVICKKAEELDVAVAVLARHSKTKLQAGRGGGVHK